MEDLETVFQHIYQFRTSWLKMPAKKTLEYLEDKVRLFKSQCSDQNQLLIVYNGGHGSFHDVGGEMKMVFGARG